MKTTINLVGEQIGRLKVIAYLGNAKWDCLCSCGNKAAITTFSLTRSTPTRSCGCFQRDAAAKSMNDRAGIPRRDITNQQFGKLLVLGFAGIDPESLGLSRHRLLWNCACDCGKKTTLRGYAITRTTRPTRSCGCLQGQSGRRKQIGIRKFKVVDKVIPKAQSPKPKAQESTLLSESQIEHIQTEYARIIALVDSGLPFWDSVDILPKWRKSFEDFRDWIEDELPPTIIGSRLVRISRYGDFQPRNIRWSSPG